MSSSPSPEIFRLAKSNLAEHPTVKFMWTDSRGRERQGFVLRDPNAAADSAEYAAYENACPHLDIPLDWDNNEFFEEEGRYIVCSTHGALFRAEDGYCVAGPCARASLPALPVKSEGDDLIVLAPVPPTTLPNDQKIPGPKT